MSCEGCEERREKIMAECAKRSKQINEIWLKIFHKRQDTESPTMAELNREKIEFNNHVSRL